MGSKEDLELLISKQEKIWNGVHDKLKDLKEELENIVETPKREAMVGRYFKYQDRYGSEDDEKWIVYVRVVEDLKGYMELKTVSFQKDSNGEITIDPKDFNSVKKLLDGEEITEGVFLEAWKSFKNEMNNAVEGG